MPVKRRTAKRRVDPTAEAKAWAEVFETRHDFFGDLPEIGVLVGASRDPDRAITEAAWHRLGALFLATRDPREDREPWALAQFGEPHAH